MPCPWCGHELAAYSFDLNNTACYNCPYRADIALEIQGMEEALASVPDDIIFQMILDSQKEQDEHQEPY